MKNIAIIGSGSWGVALATHLSRCGNEIKIWSFDQEEKRLIFSIYSLILMNIFFKI